MFTKKFKLQPSQEFLGKLLSDKKGPNNILIYHKIVQVKHVLP